MKRIYSLTALLLLAMQLPAWGQQTNSTNRELQEDPADSLQQEIVLDEVLVAAVRAETNSPVTFSNMEAERIRKRNLGQDIPVLMNYLPSVVTTSDAGAGVGYTGIRVRGSDATRVNITINGIPYNDAESQGTFWVNMPDFASSVQNLQLQRGVGTSTNGAGAFGASLNLLTDAVGPEAYAELAASAGSFNTHKATLKFSSGLLSDHFEISGRLSRIASEGYIDRASSDLDSYFLQGAYLDDNTLIKALLFGGHEITYQSWYGFDPAILSAIGVDNNLETNRTFNVAGVQFDAEGNFEGFYENQVDNYKQDHFQLHWSESWSPSLRTNIALHYTRGRGFFEEYVDEWYYTNVFFAPDAGLDFLGQDPVDINGETRTTTDYIRRRWLDNDFYGTVFSAQYRNAGWQFTLGGGWNTYRGDHFGEVIWARNAPEIDRGFRYYEDDSQKDDFNTFLKAETNLSERLRFFADVQYRGVRYQANGNETGLVDDRFNFFNPKTGLTYTLNDKQNLYFSYAVANREPNRNDYENGNPRPERLQDFELGWRYLKAGTSFQVNGYYMRYKDQLVLTGELNDVGAPIRANVGDSYRLGIELDASLPLGNRIQWQPNLALSINRNVDFFFRRDGELRNLGNTEIAFSPGVVAGSRLVYSPGSGWQIAVLNKYVGDQFMSNIEAERSRLEGYSQTDLNLVYTLPAKGGWPELTFTGLVNNLFDARFSSNGFFYTFDDDFSNPGTITTIEGVGYYPQAGIHFLAGVTARF
ncbi:iron complex outermembrane recepter protein [Robiginitalea myxolifaciens]|uniref:Iron complex outermembrane recepter protein n=1 Tax=Robiginitalea myxolifaciens TaxID=400055 RepID=A0A1I6G7Y7_9FLAO|nr:TonB-dependent receptor [Robiginitalea myxolifaciens]SFR38313.1 iron complex outermembrane recepter protein [Robiginitalea myxolifaciens]